MDQAFEEGARGDDNSTCPPRPARLADDSGHTSNTIRSVLDDEVFNAVLDQREVRILTQNILHRLAIELAISLRAGASDGGTLRPVEHPELDTAAIRRAAHDAIERIDFTDQMSLAQPANGRVAGHLPDGGKLVGDQGGLGPESGRRGRSLGPSMAAANDNDVEGFAIHGRRLPVDERVM